MRRRHGGIVIELQASPIDPYTIEQREKAYGHMLWIFNALDYQANIDLRDKGDFLTFRWKWPRLTQSHCTAPLYWDFPFLPRQVRVKGIAGQPAPQPKSVEMLRVKKLGTETPCGGWGTPLTRKGFVWKYLSDWLPGKAVIETRKERHDLDDAAANILRQLEEEERGVA